MNFETIINAVIILALIGFIGVRQMSWRPVVVGRMWRLPIILAAVGLFTMSSQAKGEKITSFDIAVLAIELVISLGAGAVMGAIAKFRPLPRSSEPGAPEYESRTGVFGLVLWVFVIVVRIGIDFWAGQMGSALITSTGVILVAVAANRLARTAVFASRVAKLDSVSV